MRVKVRDAAHMARSKRNGLKSPLTKHDTEDSYEETLELVTDYHCKGFSQFQITKQLFTDKGIRVSQPMVSKYLKTIRERWRDKSVASREEHVNEQLRKYDVVSRELWLAWEASKEDERVVNKEYAVPLRLKTAVDEAAPDREEGGKAARSRDEKKLALVAKKVKSNERLPSSQYMSLIISVLQMKCDLLGLAAPKEAKLELSGGDGKAVLDWGGRANALPAMRDIEAELARVKDIVDAEVVVKQMPDKPNGGKR